MSRSRKRKAKAGLALVRETKARYRNRLQKCRLRAEIPSQAELARRTKIDRTTISHLEGNRVFLSIHYALRLREVLGCSLDDLYEEIPSEGAKPESDKSKRT